MKSLQPQIYWFYCYFVFIPGVIVHLVLFTGTGGVGSGPLSRVACFGLLFLESMVDFIEGAQCLIGDYHGGDGCITATWWF